MNDDTNDGVGRATSIGLSELIPIFRTWAEDKAFVRCELQFTSFAASFRARAVSATDRELRLVADDRWSELVLRFRDGFRFGYTDMRDSPEHSRKYDHLIVIFFPYTGDPADADKVILYEIKE